MSKRKKNKNPLYFEYIMPFIDIEEVFRQIVQCCYQKGNAICDYTIGANFSYDEDNNKYYVYKVFLLLSSPYIPNILDFNIIIEEIFVYRPEYEIPATENENVLCREIANFSIGIPPDDHTQRFYIVPTTTKLLFSSRIQKYFYNNWKYYKNFRGMLIQTNMKMDAQSIYYNTLNLTSQGCISEALDILRNENPLEYIKGSEDYERKLQVIQLQMLGFRRKYKFEDYVIPPKFMSILEYIKKWKFEINDPKVLILYGRKNSSKTRVMLSLIREKTGLEVKNIFMVEDLSFMYTNTLLFIHDVLIPLSEVNVTSQAGLFFRKEIGNLLVQSIIDSIELKSKNINIDYEEIFNNILDNLVVYDIENDFMHYLGNLVESKQLLDYFFYKKK